MKQQPVAPLDRSMIWSLSVKSIQTCHFDYLYHLCLSYSRIKSTASKTLLQKVTLHRVQQGGFLVEKATANLWWIWRLITSGIVIKKDKMMYMWTSWHIIHIRSGLDWPHWKVGWQVDLPWKGEMQQLIKYGDNNTHYQEVSPGRLLSCCIQLSTWNITETVV